MQFAKRLFMGLGVVAFMAVLFTLAAPKAVHGLVATLVQVANTAANPVPNKDVDFPVRAVIVSPGCETGTIIPILSCNAYTVPEGQRFAIEQLEAHCYTPKGNYPTAANIEVSEQGSYTLHYFPLTPQGDANVTEFIDNQQVRYYADAGSTISFEVESSDVTGNTSCEFQVNGYLASYP